MAVENPFAVLGGVIGAVLASYLGYVAYAKEGEPFDWNKFVVKAIPAVVAGALAGYASQDFVLGLSSGFVAKKLSEDAEAYSKKTS